MVHSYSNNLENYLGYAERERSRDVETQRVAKARGMLWEDFRDRLYLFMSDLSQLHARAGLDGLPYDEEIYFSDKEMRQLGSVSCLNDSNPTPEQILTSLETLVPPFRHSIEGVWQYPQAKYINWVRHHKACVPGTLRGIYADVLTEILPEEDQREREELMGAEKKAAADKAKAERRKESREKKKAYGDPGKGSFVEPSRSSEQKRSNTRGSQRIRETENKGRDI